MTGSTTDIQPITVKLTGLVIGQSPILLGVEAAVVSFSTADCVRLIDKQGNAKVSGGALHLRRAGTSVTRSVDLRNVESAIWQIDFKLRWAHPTDVLVFEASATCDKDQFTVLDTITGLSGAHDLWKDYDIQPYALGRGCVRIRIKSGYNGDSVVQVTTTFVTACTAAGGIFTQDITIADLCGSTTPKTMR